MITHKINRTKTINGKKTEELQQGIPYELSKIRKFTKAIKSSVKSGKQYSKKNMFHEKVKIAKRD